MPIINNNSWLVWETQREMFYSVSVEPLPKKIEPPRPPMPYYHLKIAKVKNDHFEATGVLYTCKNTLDQKYQALMRIVKLDRDSQGAIWNARHYPHELELAYDVPNIEHWQYGATWAEIEKWTILGSTLFG